jgi:hypothetical protein
MEFHIPAGLITRYYCETSRDKEIRALFYELLKGCLAGPSALQPLVSLLYPTPNTVVVPSFISRGAIAPSGARAFC